MENSFYYFFSATPQVLGGILALFGVFVLFKLQALSTELISVATKLADYASTYHNSNDDDTIISIRQTFKEALETWTKSKNVSKIKYILDLLTDERFKNSIQYKAFFEEFNNVYGVYKGLINDTVKSSTFTGLIIIFCLSVLTFGKWIICHPAILYLTFSVVIVCVVISFYKLLSILKKSMN